MVTITSNSDLSRRTPTPEDHLSLSGEAMIAEYSPPPGADASSESSPGSASDHMGVIPSSSNQSQSQAPLLPGSSVLAAFDAGNSKLEARQKGSDGTSVKRRQSRLQRNRESARLSRKRRKQYLELLEERVDQLSETLDRSRRQHVAEAVTAVAEKRRECVFRGTPDALKLCEQNLARTNEELRVAVTFQFQQLKSFSIPPSMQFILWLTLQTDAYFRGGRTASERLSAARIGERVRTFGDTEKHCLRHRVSDSLIFLYCRCSAAELKVLLHPNPCGPSFVTKLEFPMTKKKNCALCNERLFKIPSPGSTDIHPTQRAKFCKWPMMPRKLLLYKPDSGSVPVSRFYQKSSVANL
jgi:hypothetical protein